MNLITNLQQKISERHLLDHSFYQRWSEGSLSLEELRNYAREYFHYSLAFPTFLSAIHANCDDLTIRQAILENLIEEERGADNHPELWLRFCDSLGMDRDEILMSVPSEKTRELIDTMRTLTRDGEVHEGLGALYAYESQVPSVAKTKIEGLERFYSIRDPKAISFFTVHLAADVIHARTSEDLLDQICDDAQKRDEATDAVEVTLQALYTFLDGVNVGASEMVH
ncbi:MAG TPA: CADD family putative folate metabolism protein [Thermoanaerobaculia bacterium]|nr:CADD family putative folate metabolism protein [Thermoanaerobaculia bacterium]